MKKIDSFNASTDEEMFSQLIECLQEQRQDIANLDRAIQEMRVQCEELIYGVGIIVQSQSKNV